MSAGLINELLIILASGLVANLVCRRLGTSVLIGYLIAGVLVGRGFTGWVRDDGHEIEHFAEAGVFLLLFTIGLEFSLDDLAKAGKRFLTGGAIQMSAVAVPVGAVLIWYGIPERSACLIAAAIAFSSTVVVFKSLSEWGQTEQEHGRRAIEILLFQDAALIPLLLFIPMLTGNDAGSILDYLTLSVTSMLFVVAIIGLRMLLASILIPRLARFRSPEVVVLFVIVALGLITWAAHGIGLPPAVGAFAAGLIFNGNRWTKQVDALILPFRETFAAIFFVALGLILQPSVFVQDPWLMLGGVIGIVFLKALAAISALKVTGLPIVSAIGMGLGLAHVGEFAFVLLLQGLQAGLIDELVYQRLVGMAVGSLLLTPPLLQLGLKRIRSEEHIGDSDHPSLPDTNAPEAIVIGGGLIGRRVAAQLETMGMDVSLVDLSPLNLHEFAQEGFRTVAGDALESSVLQRARVTTASWILVSVPQDDVALRIVKRARRLNPSAQILVRCRYQGNVTKLLRIGGDVVVSEESEALQAILQAIAK